MEKDEGLYNVFLNNGHSTKQEKMLVQYNLNVVRSLLKRSQIANKKSVELLELGVGKGYFAQACLISNQTVKTKIHYNAFDRNSDMLKNLKNFDKNIETYKGSLPDISIPKKKFDIVYCAFVVEHLKGGLELFELISNLKKILNKNGIIVFFTPNALSQKFEFYNIDYTHQYPTTARNVTMAFADCGIKEVDVLKINGLCTYKYFDNNFVRIVHKALFSLYSYRMFSIIFLPFYKVPLHSLNNFFYRVFCFFKEENLMFVATYRSRK